MKNIHDSKHDSVLEQLEKTYPTYKLCSYENLGRITNEFKITNKPRFWNERCEEVLSVIHDIDVTFHRYPEKYQMKMIVSPQFESLFSSQIFPFLEKKIQYGKTNPEYIAIMIKMCEIYLRLGLDGMKKTMPSEFQHILQAKFDDIMLLMDSINQYTKRLAPKESNAIDFDFNFYEKKERKKKSKKK